MLVQWRSFAFSYSDRFVKRWSKTFPVLLSIGTLFIVLSGYGLHYEALAGHFFDLGIRFLRDPAYLSTLFPEKLYCYRFNEKGEELFVSIFSLSSNLLFKWLCLITWFWMVFTLIVQAILAVQLISFKRSKTYRFRRLMKFFPTVDEKLLRQLSELDYRFCISLEYYDCFSDRLEFRKFLDYLATFKTLLETRISIVLPKQENPDPNALAVVAVK